MLNNQRTSRFSCVLLAANALCGLAAFVLAREIALDLVALQPSLLLPTRLFLGVGPWGWLAFMLSSSALLLVSHASFRQHWLTRGVTAASWMALSGEVVGVACFAAVQWTRRLRVCLHSVVRGGAPPDQHRWT